MDERKFLFTGILLIVIVILIIKIGIPSGLNLPPPQYNSKDYLSLGKSLDTPSDTSSGTSKDRSLYNKLYYNLYGWRTQPPYEYPQKTIDTPYDKTMRECTRLCTTNKISAYGLPKDKVRDCHKICQIRSLEKQGVPQPLNKEDSSNPSKEGYYRDSGLFVNPLGLNILNDYPPPNVCNRDCVNTFSDEIGYSHESSYNRINEKKMRCFNW